MGLVLEHLRVAGRDLIFRHERIEEMIGAIEMRSHPLRNEIVRLTKRCIALVKRGDRSLVPQVMSRLPEIPREFEEFAESGIFNPVEKAELIGTSQAECVECLLFDAYYSRLGLVGVGGRVEIQPKTLTAENLGVSDQAYCNGLVDLVGELAKAVLDWRALRDPKMEDEIFVLNRFLEIARDIVTFLSEIEGVPEKYLAVTSREGDFRSTFYGKLIGAKRLIVEHRTALEQLKLWQRLERRLLPAPSEASV